MSVVSSSNIRLDALRPELTLLQSLAQRVNGFQKRQLTKGAITQASTCILDTIGVTLAGYSEPCTQIILNTPGVAAAPGPALIFGSARRTGALDAALVNGTASHALDFDDFSGIMGGHHSVPLVAMLSAGDAVGVAASDAADAGPTPREFLAATSKRYAVPSARPVMFSTGAGELNVTGFCAALPTIGVTT